MYSLWSNEVGENPHQREGDMAETRSLTHHGRECAQFTHYKITLILLLLWAELYKDQGKKPTFFLQSIICQEVLPSCQSCFMFKSAAF